MIRLFAALAVPDEIVAGLVRRQDGVPGARWREPDQLHITLRFFGEVSEPVACDLDAELSRLRGQPLDLALSGAGSFGEGREVRAIWAGVERSQALDVLAGRCEAAARRAGLKPEGRPYLPHLTLAYLHRADEAKVSAWIQGHNLLRSPAFRVDRFGLYSSWTSSHGSRYELEREYALG